MNYKAVIKILGKTMIIVALLLLCPIAVGFCYGEKYFLSFLLPAGLLCAIGVPLSLIKTQDKAIYAREGVIIVALCWIILSLSGAMPFVISGVIPNFFDAFFESASGFTTTGATVLSGTQLAELMSSGRSLMFWRVFTHWIGGMGVLVFVLAVLPSKNEGSMYLYRAESPGPSASKFVSKMSYTARILYGIYAVMTLAQVIVLLFGGLSLYDAVLTAFSTAGTGGFGLYGDSLAHYNSAFVEMTVAVFMLLFSINFNVYFAILTCGFFKAFKNEEVVAYLVIEVVATVAIAFNIIGSCANFFEALRYSFFQVTSISSTTGFATVDYNTWPSFSKGILLFLMIVGGCGGSTCGGIKVSRLIILCKSGAEDIKKTVHPRRVSSVMLDGKPIGRETERNVLSYIVMWAIVVVVATLLLSLDSFSGGDLLTDLSAAVTCIGNVGPGFNLIGPIYNFSGYNSFSKLVLSVVMIAGRLEIFPLIVLFSPRAWRKNY